MTVYGALRAAFFVVVGVVFVLSQGAFAYYRMREWRTLSFGQRFAAVRDVLGALAVLFFAAVIALATGLAALQG